MKTIFELQDQLITFRTDVRHIYNLQLYIIFGSDHLNALKSVEWRPPQSVFKNVEWRPQKFYFVFNIYFV